MLHSSFLDSLLYAAGATGWRSDDINDVDPAGIDLTSAKTHCLPLDMLTFHNVSATALANVGVSRYLGI